MQVYGNTNAPKSVTYSAIIYCLRCLINLEMPLNQGALQPITISIPDGCLLSPSDTAAVVGGNVLTSQRLCDVILKAFRACAASQGIQWKTLLFYLLTTMYIFRFKDVATTLLSVAAARTIKETCEMVSVIMKRLVWFFFFFNSLFFSVPLELIAATLIYLFFFCIKTEKPEVVGRVLAGMVDQEFIRTWQILESPTPRLLSEDILLFWGNSDYVTGPVGLADSMAETELFVR